MTEMVYRVKERLRLKGEPEGGKGEKFDAHDRSMPTGFFSRKGFVCLCCYLIFDLSR